MRSYHGALFNRICEEVQQNMAIKWPEGGNKIPWKEVSVELLLHIAMTDLKPVGVNRNFMMLFIHDRFTSYVDKDLYSKPIWDHLDSMYDMAALHESEILPFPSEEIDFELPAEFDDIVMEKFNVALPHTQVEESQSKSNTPLKSIRKMSASKLKPNFTPTLGKNKEPFNPKQSTPSTTVVHKSGKSTPNSKSDEKPAIAESSNSSKNKKEISMPAKITKSKRSSSPFSTKSSKSETRESSPDISVVRKSKPERSSSPALTKKPPVKTESPSTPVSVKKTVSKELVKHIKSDSSDSPIRKIKNERDSVGKKGKLPSSETPGSKKGGKVDSSNGVRKLKSDSDNSAKKNVDSSSNKQHKVDKNVQNAHSKGLKSDDVDALLASGSRKSSPIVKLESVDSLKKRKRQKVEESPKKPTPQPKRRRT